MLIALLKTIYKKSIPEGVVDKTWRVIISLAAFLFIVYFTIPFFVLLSQETKDIIVAFILFFGAMDVLINPVLAHRIITA
jgi:Na+-transporting NADH:ubiquinone oxidoreductase subunit NqrB